MTNLPPPSGSFPTPTFTTYKLGPRGFFLGGGGVGVDWEYVGVNNNVVSINDKSISHLHRAASQKRTTYKLGPRGFGEGGTENT